LANHWLQPNACINKIERRPCCMTFKAYMLTLWGCNVVDTCCLTT